MYVILITYEHRIEKKSSFIKRERNKLTQMNEKKSSRSYKSLFAKEKIWLFDYISRKCVEITKNLQQQKNYQCILKVFTYTIMILKMISFIIKIIYKTKQKIKRYLTFDTKRTNL